MNRSLRCDVQGLKSAVEHFGVQHNEIVCMACAEFQMKSKDIESGIGFKVVQDEKKALFVGIENTRGTSLR
ncbi:hypothetical protein CKO25_11615 [Thiocapsa imhoffii]|uniref:Uncharacterized protein n=1 Tax=Thiocapsa imhoffii TaxID=382777 RepID=A0A9X1B9N9_9GAMM|nr:hypothetical protein [Thiocapsa imhoffii]